MSLAGQEHLTKVVVVVIGTIFLIISLLEALALEAFYAVIRTSSITWSMAFVWFTLAFLVAGTLLMLELSMSKHRTRNNEVITVSCIAIGCAIITLGGLWFAYVALWEISAMYGAILILTIWPFVGFLRTKQTRPKLSGSYWYCSVGHQNADTFRFCPYCGEMANSAPLIQAHVQYP